MSSKVLYNRVALSCISEGSLVTIWKRQLEGRKADNRKINYAAHNPCKRPCHIGLGNGYITDKQWINLRCYSESKIDKA